LPHGDVVVLTGAIGRRWFDFTAGAHMHSSLVFAGFLVGFVATTLVAFCQAAGGAGFGAGAAGGTSGGGQGTNSTTSAGG
jgi:hypothetical protein